MKIKLSKGQWEKIGKTAGWMRKAKGILEPTAEIRGLIDNIFPQIMQEVKNVQRSNCHPITKQKLYPNPKERVIEYFNPVTKKNEKVSIIVKSKLITSLETEHGYIPSGVFGSKEESSSINILVPKIEDSNGNPIKTTSFTEKDVYDMLLHETVHALDPKTRLDWSPLSSTTDGGAYGYYLDAKEIDAFQQTIVNGILDAIKNNHVTIEDIISQLRSSSFSIDNIQLDNNTKNAFNFWLKNKPEIMKLLKQRIHTAISKYSSSN